MNIFNRLSDIIEYAQSVTSTQTMVPSPDSFYFGDNLALLQQLPAGCLDFIYVDPPFFTNGDFKTKTGQQAYSDKWVGLDEFLSMLTPRLKLMVDSLSETGLLAIHLDYRTVHYVKVLMDALVGEKNLVNELIWTYKSGGSSGRSFSRKHDTILLYAKGPGYYFSPQKEKSYNRGLKPYRFKGVAEYQDEVGWYTLVNRKDVLQVNMVGRSSRERCGYPTQKPLELMEILLESCTREESLCADFFCGSGSLGVAAQKKNRRFVLCDSGEPARDMCIRRLSSETQELKIIQINKTR